MIRHVIIEEPVPGFTVPGVPLGKFLGTEEEWLLHPSTYEMIRRLRVVIPLPGNSLHSLPIHHRCIVELDIPNEVFR